MSRGKNACSTSISPIPKETASSGSRNSSSGGLTEGLISPRRPAGKPGKRDRSLKHRIMSLLPFGEAHCDRLVRLERVHAHRVEPVEPEAGIPIRAGVSVVV